MEKKTIGQFIAALRKASGMTQKQLSEKLNVSDKAVSRWERDECAPDLSLIPVIAEIFGVTSDEILRGERRFEQVDFAESSVTSAKSSKQIEHILNDTKLKFSIRSIISVGIAVVGLLGAMLCNFGFNRAGIGFIVACILYLAAVVCEVIFVKLAYSSISDDDFESEKYELCKKNLFNTSFLTFSVISVLFAVTLPLVFLLGSAYWGLTAESWFVYGLVFGIVAFFLCAILKIIGNRLALKFGLYSLPEKEKEKADKVFKWDKKCLMILVCILVPTFIGQSIFNEIASRDWFVDCRTFTSVEDFIEFMETPMTQSNIYYERDGLSKIEINESANVDVVTDYTFYVNGEEVSTAPDDYFRYDSGAHYFDQYGNEIPEEIALKRNFYNKNDEVIATYVERNQTVSYYSVDWDGDELEKITVMTFDDVRKVNTIMAEFNELFAVLYFFEIIIVILIWFIRRLKIK